jgi:hypothetical protein
MEKTMPQPGPHNRFAEVIKKSKERRAEMNRNSDHAAEPEPRQDIPEPVIPEPALNTVDE